MLSGIWFLSSTLRFSLFRLVLGNIIFGLLGRTCCPTFPVFRDFQTLERVDFASLRILILDEGANNTSIIIIRSHMGLSRPAGMCIVHLN